MRLGVKAAPGDAAASLDLPHATFVETVLFHGHMMDLDATADAYAGLPVEVVHQPFTVREGIDMDVAHPDAKIRAETYAAWDACMDLADRLGAPWVVLHPGGVAPADTADDDLGPLRADALEHTTAALERFADQHGTTRVLIENLPDPYGFNDGRRGRSLTLLGLVDWMGWRELAAGLCLDTSHACLTPGGAKTLATFLSRAAKDVRHLHLSDAVPPDGEGAQIGAPGGIVPWDDLVPRLQALERDHDRVLTAVPEVQGGHLDDFAGFKAALDQLDTWFA